MPVVKDKPPRSPGRSKKGARSKDSSSQKESKRPPKSKPKQPSPPNRVEPGWVHEAAAGILLQSLAALAAANDVKLDIGDTEPEPIEAQFTGEDGPQPVEVTARLLAHLAHRIPGVKKLEKRFEGKDTKAGIGSDLMALVMQLYTRNKSQIDNAASDIVQEKVFHKKPTGSGGVIVDFGEVQPAGSNNNNGGSENA